MSNLLGYVVIEEGLKGIVILSDENGGVIHKDWPAAEEMCEWCRNTVDTFGYSYSIAEVESIRPGIPEAKLGATGGILNQEVLDSYRRKVACGGTFSSPNGVLKQTPSWRDISRLLDHIDSLETQHQALEEAAKQVVADLDHRWERSNGFIGEEGNWISLPALKLRAAAPRKESVASLRASLQTIKPEMENNNEG